LGSRNRSVTNVSGLLRQRTTFSTDGGGIDLRRDQTPASVEKDIAAILGGDGVAGIVSEVVTVTNSRDEIPERH